MTKAMKIQIGDSVRVKTGAKDPDFGIDIGGWQDQVTEIEDNLVTIAWDSVTLSIFPDKYISQCEDEGLDWKIIWLEIKDVESVAPRDSEIDMVEKQKEIQSQHHWDHLGDSGKRISKILHNINPEDYLAAFDTWEKYLSRSLSFPFDAEISEYQSKGPLRQGDKIRIHSILGRDESYGVIVKLRYGRRVYHFPLCDIEVLDDKSDNHQIVEDYSVWFANRS